MLIVFKSPSDGILIFTSCMHTFVSSVYWCLTQMWYISKIKKNTHHSQQSNYLNNNHVYVSEVSYRLQLMHYAETML